MKAEQIDNAADIALEEWNTWAGRAFNLALDELGLIEEEYSEVVRYKGAFYRLAGKKDGEVTI